MNTLTPSCTGAHTHIYSSCDRINLRTDHHLVRIRIGASTPTKSSSLRVQSTSASSTPSSSPAATAAVAETTSARPHSWLAQQQAGSDNA